MSHVSRKPVFGVLTRSDPNLAVQPQKMASALKFQILEVEGLYSLCSENKGAYQLGGDRAADLCLCFCYMQKAVFLMMRLLGLSSDFLRIKLCLGVSS